MNNYNDTIYVDWGSQPVTGIIDLTETTLEGCVSFPISIDVNVGAPSIELGEDDYICRGIPKTIVPEGDFTSYLWHDGSTGSDFTTDQEGWIYLEVTDSNGCINNDSIYVSVIELPVVDLGNDTTLCGEQSLVLDAGTDGQIYSWSSGENSQQINVFQGPQVIWVDVENSYGCIGSDTIAITACNLEFFFRDIPTAITANNDGMNDVWNLVKLRGYSQAVVDIYDQWGTLVWKSEPGYPDPWDGRSMNGKMMPVDSYHFVIDFNDGTDARINGIVTVIR